jgi:heterodisulfide reductase subunit A-like polyferredoxin
MYEKKGRYIVEFPDIPKDRQHHIEIDVEARRGNYEEVELGFDEARAVQEAKRCLSCRRCLGCALCWAECKPEAINFELEDEVFDLEFDEVILSPGVERPLDRLDRKYGFGKYLNVITDTQLERMLAESGPSAGLIIRPFDGEVPASIAVVQSYEKAAANLHHAALCFAINGAIQARRKLPQAEIEVLATDLDEFRKAQQAALDRLDRLELLEASVKAVEELDNHSLKLVIGTNGAEQSKVFDLVVLITQPQISKALKDLAKALGLSFSYAGFLSSDGGDLIRSDKETVQMAAAG